MDRLIKRSDVLRILCETCRAEEACVEGLVGNCEAFKAIVDLDPVQETKRGEWVEDGFLNRKTCSVCGRWIADYTGTAVLNYCPNCGADMRCDKSRTIELKPCPFCGGEAEMVTEYGTTVRACCKTCKCTTKVYGANVRYCAADKAAEKWNLRTYQPQEIEREFMRICEQQMEHEPIGGDS